MNGYLAALQGSWQALCPAERGGRVVRTEAFLAACSPHPFLNNGVLLRPEALDELCGLYGDEEEHAVWTAADDRRAEAVLRKAGFAPDVTTRPMLCAGSALPTGVSQHGVAGDVPPAVVAGLNGVPAEVLEDVPGLRCFATAGDDAGLVLQEVRDAVVMSFVATRPAARGRGLATRLVAAALSDARARGAAQVALQATPQAEAIYRRLGFRAVGAWQEWTPPARQRNSSRTSSVVGCDWQVSTTPASSSSGSSA